MKNRWAQIGLLFVVGAGLWWASLVFWSEPRDRQTATDGSSPRFPTGEPSPASGSAVEKVETARFQEPDVGRPAEPGSDLPALGVTLRFLEPDGRPAVEIPVQARALLGETDLWISSDGPGPSDFVSEVEWITDGEGRVRLETLPTVGLQLFAKSGRGALSGPLLTPDGLMGQEKVLRLKADRPVDLVVRGPDGGPVAGALVLLPGYGAVVTAEDGVARAVVDVRHRMYEAPAVVASLLSPDGRDPREDPSAVEVPWAEAGPTRVDLLAPRLVSVFVGVQVTGAEFAPATLIISPRPRPGGTVVVSPSRNEPTPEVVAVRLSTARTQLSLPSGPVAFSLREPGRATVLLETEIPDVGRTEVWLRQGELLPVVVIPLVGPEAAAWGPTLVVTSGFGDPVPARFQAGQLEVEVPAYQELALRVQRTFSRGLTPCEVLGEVHVPPLPEGVRHVADPVRLEEAPALVGGWVRNAAGEPCPGARVRLVPRGPVPDEELWRVSDVSRCDVGGRFVIRQAPPPGAWAVFAAGPSGLRVEPFEPGSEVQQLMLEPPGFIEASADVVGASNTVVWAIREDGGVPARVGWNVPELRRHQDSPTDGVFRVGPLAAGVYTVRVERGTQLHREVRDVQVSSGATVRPQELWDRDLSMPAASAGTVTVLDPAGRPVAGASVYLVDPQAMTAAGRRRRKTGEDGVATFEVVPGATYTVWVRSEGFCPDSIGSARLPMTVTLTEGSTVRLAVRVPGDPLPLTGWRVSLVPAEHPRAEQDLVMKSPGSEDPEGVWVLSGRGGAALFGFGRGLPPGPARVWILVPVSDSRPRDLGVIQVPLGPGIHELELPVTREALGF